jgi:UDP-glucose 4-epimerase|tara:strand:+ start:2042 stop:2908 length:867 start_codon:yes stop_codon:yes gene_type:complete
MAKCLVTGAAGFIGHNLVGRLLKDGNLVIGMDNFLTGSKENVQEHENYTFMEYDLTWETPHIDDVDYVFHLAALPRVPVSFDEPYKSLTNNIIPTINALEICRKSCAKMIYSSSSSIYGNQISYPTNEEASKHMMSPYARAKWIGEELCLEYEQAFDVPFVALRYFNVYGPGMTSGGYATAIKIFLEQRAEDKPLTVTGDGEQMRDFTHVDDVVNANIKCMKKGSGAFNIGAGSPRKIIDIARMISDDIQFIDKRNEPHLNHADYTKAKRELDWLPLAHFDDKLNELL